MNRILFYRTNEVPYGSFSNFDTRHPLVLLGLTWPSTEHYYQAMKFWGTDDVYAAQIRVAVKPRIAADMGRVRSHPLRADWEQVKDDVMRTAIFAKIAQHPDMKDLLLSTGDAELIEHSSNDNYWADGGDGRGKNMLGKILMEVREECRIWDDMSEKVKSLQSLLD